MMDEVAAALAAMKRADRKPPANFIFITDPPSGLRAFLVLDSLALGPAAGGVRTHRYPSAESALRDALDLARAMTLKCALAGLDAGGGKCVVMDHDGLDRPRAFEHLGMRIEALRGAFRTAGDLGTTRADLEAMAKTCQYVYTDERGLAAAVARGMLRCIEACAAERGRKDIAGMRVAIQGAGSIGSAVAEALSNEGARVLCADIDADKAERLAHRVRGRTCSAEEILFAEVDIVAPCAAGGVITADVARGLRASAVCGAANNILASAEAAQVLVERGILHVPDPIASAGAVIEGVGQLVMNLPDRTPLIDRLGETAREVLAEARRTGRTPSEVAEARALRTVGAGKGSGSSPPSKRGIE